MYQPTTRLLTVLELLQARGSLTGPELAERLEVDRRSIRRYVTMLQDLGIPIEGRRGPAGGYRLRPGYKLPPLMFSDQEAVAADARLDRGAAARDRGRSGRGGRRPRQAGARFAALRSGAGTGCAIDHRDRRGVAGERGRERIGGAAQPGGAVASNGCG